MDFGLGDHPIRNPGGSSAPHASLVTGHSSLFFAYGTLRRGLCRHKFLKTVRAQFLSRGMVLGILYDLGEFPGAVPSETPSSLVCGEVYRLSDSASTLKVLDKVEGIAAGSPEHNLYRRDLAIATLENGANAEVWIYWLKRLHVPKRRISSGDYFRISEV